MSLPRILAMAGSLRQGSYNVKLLKNALQVFEQVGVEADVVDLKRLALPFYDADLEASGPPPAVVEFRERCAQAQGLLLATPEYNHSSSAVLLNALDWVSRPPHELCRGKVAAIMGASTDPYGSARALIHLRTVLSSLGMLVAPATVRVSHAHEAFDENDILKDEALRARVTLVVAQFLKLVVVNPLAPEPQG